MNEAVQDRAADQLGFLPEAEARVAVPEPERSRFQPLRAGILNLWQYDDQELRFHQGRLILRGENGTGKSKALELLLPFLLDADLRPHRLDPFAGTARTMRWNLLEGTRHDSRVGYVWLELGRRLDDGGSRVLTLGCGLRATQRVQRVDSWYFVTERRVGADLDLLTAARQPLTREQLRQALGEEGAVYTQAGEYRERVDAELYGLGADRFDALRHLLLQLRRPHLSEKLDPNSLSELLGNSLPPLDDDLIGQLSEGFQRLEHEEAELRRLEQAGSRVESFLGVYREYCRGVARQRSADLRRSESRYHKKAAELRDTEGELETIEAELADLEDRRQSLDEEVTRSRGTLAALERSEAMKAAQALRTREEHTVTLERQASRDRRDADRLEEVARDRRRDRDGATRDAERAEEELAGPDARAADAAREAGTEAVHESAAGHLAADPAVHRREAVGIVEAALEERHGAVREVRALLRDRDLAVERFTRAEERRRDAEEGLRAAAERRQAAVAAVDEARAALDDAVVAWAGELVELRLDEEELDGVRATAAAVGGEPGGDAASLAAAAEALAAPRRDALAGERGEREADRRAAVADRDDVDAERRRVEAARELGPEPPPTRETPRGGRPGAPFYRLCDFRADLAGADRAGLEAALEASGLLDAWVTPEGEALAADTLDTVLLPEPLAGGTRTLADLFVPATAGDDEEADGKGKDGEEPAGPIDDAVDAEVVRRLLRSVAVGDHPEARCRVDVDGSFRHGPLHGRWRKEAAEHVGAAAREAARRRRLAELEERLAELDARIAELDAALEALAERRRRLDGEARSVPPASEVAGAVVRAEAAAAEEGRRREELARAEEAVSSARRERDAAVQRLEARARELRLADHLGDLGGYEAALHRYRTAFGELVQARIALQTATRAAERAGALADEASAAAGEAGRRAAASVREAGEARAELDALRATVGEEAAAIVARHQEEKGRLEKLEAEVEEVGENRVAGRELRAGIVEKRRHLTGELEERDADRQAALERLRHLAETGFLALVLTADELGDEPPASWSAKRSLELARRVEQTTSDVDLSQDAADRRTNRLHQRYQELLADLGGEFRPSLEHDEELLRIRVDHNQRQYDVAGLLAMLGEEVRTRRDLLDNDERELLRRFLLGEVGAHLRRRLREAHALVDHMNGLLDDCATASGMTLRLAWQANPDEASNVRKATRSLLHDPSLLSDEDRKHLEGFFAGRIEAARGDYNAVPWREHLTHALDYRHWHHFRIQRRIAGEGEWRDLTSRGHAAASGGEKAVALHLPLFAAAAAHYRSARPEAPRLIMLDEAFAGIDQGMRGRCMGLLVAFDLDFMMTSHDEWGCYRELPGVATYQLYRDPTLGGVATIRCVWNGERLIEEASA